MNPKESLQLLDSLTAEFSLKRADHVRVQEAIQVLKEAISKKPKPKKKGV